MEWINCVSTATCCGKTAEVDGVRCFATISGSLEIEPLMVVEVVNGVVSDAPSFNVIEWLRKGCGRHLVSLPI